MKKPIDKCSVCGSSCDIESCQPSKLIQKLIHSVRRECGGCGAEFVSDESLNQHIKSDCPLSFVPCKFAPFGCDESITRKQYDNHMHSSMEKHLALLADSIADKKAKEEERKEGREEEEEEEDEGKKEGESSSEKKSRKKKLKWQRRSWFRVIMAGVLVVVGLNLVRALSCRQLVLLGVLVLLSVHLLCFCFSRIFRRCRSEGFLPCPFKRNNKNNKNNKNKNKKNKKELKMQQHHHSPSPSPSSSSSSPSLPSSSSPLDGRF